MKNFVMVAFTFILFTGCGASRGWGRSTAYMPTTAPGYGNMPQTAYQQQYPPPQAPMGTGYGYGRSYDPRYQQYQYPPAMYAGGGVPNYGSYGYAPNVPAYTGTSLDVGSHGAVVATDGALLAATRRTGTPAPSPPPTASASGDYATAGQLDVVIDQVLDLNGEVRTLRREVGR